jgi:hypothetical protein
VTESGSIRWKRHAASMETMIMHTKFWLEIFKGKGLFERPRDKCEDNIKIYIEKIKCILLEWMEIVEMRSNRGIKFQLPYN